MSPRHETAAKPPDLSGSLLLFAAVAAGAAAMEAALVPGVLIGGAAWLAPKAMARLRGGKRNAGSAERMAAPQRRKTVGWQGWSSWKSLPLATSAAKTVTFRVISTGLDFGWNYYLLGEIAAAASLSGVSLVAAPTFYFLHETLWSRIRPKEAVGAGEESVFRISSDIGGVKVSKTMAKTLTFRLFATASEFGVNYAAVRDIAMATKLSAFGFVAGPFIYLAHERAWERYEARHRRTEIPPPRLLAAPKTQGV